MSRIAELNLIGCVMIDSKSIRTAYGQVEPNMFMDDMLGAIFKGMLALYENGTEITSISIIDEVECKSITREDITRTLIDSAKELITTAGIRGYIKQIVDDYKVNQVKGLFAWEVENMTTKNVNDKIGVLIAELEALNKKKKTSLVKLSDVVESQAKKHFREKEHRGIKTGFERLDSRLGELEGGDVCVVAARPSVGKSAFAMQIAEQMAAGGKRVAVYSLEMAEKQLYERWLSSVSGIELQRIRLATAYLNDEQERVEDANSVLKSLDILLSTEPKKASEIRTECAHRDIDCIIIDYLQLLEPENKSVSRENEVSGIMWKIKQIAMEFKIPVIVLSQLNRALEGRADKEPMMADLRESGSIEQDASVILMLWSLGDDKQYKGFKIEKNRQGELDRYLLEFDGAHQRFSENSKMTIKEAQKWSKTDGNNPFQ